MNVPLPAQRDLKKLIPYVTHGADFSYVVGELIGELNCSHSYVRMGDVPRPERIGTGLEEDVLVTETGAVYLSDLQEDLILIG